MLLYLCDGMNLTGDPSVGVSMECDGVSEGTQPCRGTVVLAAWAVGGNVSTSWCMCMCIIIYSNTHVLSTIYSGLHIPRECSTTHWWYRQDPYSCVARSAL